jgi:hypothetical protein
MGCYFGPYQTNTTLTLHDDIELYPFAAEMAHFAKLL